MDISLPNFIQEFHDYTKDHVDFNQRCNILTKEIQCGRTTILNVVELFGPFLTNSSPSKRELGVLVLTKVLEALPNNFLNSGQVHSINLFFADRLKDHHQVVPVAIKGLIALSKYPFPDGDATLISTSLFQNISCQQQQQEDRFNIYKLIKVLLEKYTTELLSSGYDFVYGVISAVDGERDPRNLMFLFNWYPIFLKTVDLGHLSEEMFEVLACYFPVDFKAPQQEPNSISRDSLADALAPCLCAIPQFSELCLTLALEKLDSSLTIAKMDSLKLITLGCDALDVESYQQHSTEIWSQIQKELFSCSDPEIEALCSSTIKAVIRKLSHSPPEHFHKILTDILDTLKGNLLAESRLFKQSSKYLLYVAEACDASFRFILREIVPILVNLFNISSKPIEQSTYLEMIITFSKIYFEQKESKDLDMEELKTVPHLCIRACLSEDMSLKVVGLQSLQILAQSLPLDYRNLIYARLKTMLIVTGEDNIRKSVLNLFQSLARFYPEEVYSNCLSGIEPSNSIQIDLYLESICNIAVEPFFRDIIIDKFLSYSGNIEVAHICFNNLKNLVTDQAHNEDFLRVLLEKNLIQALVSWIVTHRDALNKEQEALLWNITIILNSIIGPQDVDVQKNIITSELPRILDTYNSNDVCAVMLLYGLLSRLRNEVHVDEGIVDLLIEIAFSHKDNIKMLTVQLLANIVNKASETNLKLYLYKIEEAIKHLKEKDEKLENILLVQTWICKALTMRNYSAANLWVDKLLNYLDLSCEAAKSFDVIIDDSYPCLSKDYYCNRSFLYQQKFFNYVTNFLCSNYKPDKRSYLLSLGYLLKNAPQQVVIIQFEKILNMFILCLSECKETDVLYAMLNLIKDLLIKKVPILEDRIQEFLPRLMLLSQFEKSMKIRIVALHCLKLYTGYTVYKLLPFKQDVLKHLASCTNDKKRLVRKEAVCARCAWYLLDAPV